MNKTDYEYDERLSRFVQSKRETCYNCVCLNEADSKMNFGINEIRCKQDDKRYTFPVGVEPTCARFNKRKLTPEEQLYEHETRLQMLEKKNASDLNGIS